MSAVLELEGVSKRFRLPSGRVVEAVRSVNLDVGPGEAVALIGESGSGKSTVGRLALGLLVPDQGDVRFRGRSLGTLAPRQLRKIRSSMTPVFQEPYESLNPRMTIGSIIGEPLRIHDTNGSKQARRERVMQVLREVGLDHLDLRTFPIELSGGQQQRVNIARAIVTGPDVLILDEPTSSLDLSVQGGILQLLKKLQHDQQLTYLYISHDIATVEFISDRVFVMRRGEIVEEGLTSAVISNPGHEYTRSLLAARLSSVPRDRGADPSSG